MFARCAEALRLVAAASCNVWPRRQPLFPPPARTFWASSLRSKFRACGRIIAGGPKRRFMTAQALDKTIFRGRHMQRREFIALLGSVAIAVPRNAVAQTPSKVYRLALVSPGGLVPEIQPNAKFLLGALAQRGYTLGQNLVFEGPPGVPGQA